MKAPTKQATRGQEKIFHENRETLLYYSAASALGSAVFALVYTFFWTASWPAWVRILHFEI